jgi:hypothetical protein
MIDNKYYYNISIITNNDIIELTSPCNIQASSNKEVKISTNALIDKHGNYVSKSIMNN